MVEVAAKTTAAELAELGIVEQVSSFTTYFTGGQGRSRNIIQVAKEVDGAIVRPGETFSLNGHTGPRGYDEGYVDAPVIQDGKLVNAAGGGISQFTTTLFNAMYYAGLEDVFHKPHSYYFSRYPSVIESTIFYPSLDLKFRNDSPHGVLIDTSYTDSSVTVRMWSTQAVRRLDPVEPEAQHHHPGDDPPARRAGLHRHVGPRRLHPGRLADLQAGRCRGEAGEVLPPVRGRTQLHVRPLTNGWCRRHRLECHSIASTC